MIASPRSAAPPLLLGSLCVTIGCVDPGAADPLSAERAPAEIVAMLGGEAGYAAVANPQTVEAFRVKPIPPTPIPPGGDPPKTKTKPPWIADYTQHGGPIAVSDGQAKELSAALTSPDWLSPNVVKGCMPIYGLKLRFTGRDGTVVDVWQCFACDTLAVVKDGEAAGDDSETLRTLLKTIAQTAFPKDEAFADLD